MLPKRNISKPMDINTLKEAIKICKQVEETPHGQVAKGSNPFVYGIGANECVRQLERLLREVKAEKAVSDYKPIEAPKPLW